MSVACIVVHASGVGAMYNLCFTPSPPHHVSYMYTEDRKNPSPRFPDARQLLVSLQLTECAVGVGMFARNRGCIPSFRGAFSLRVIRRERQRWPTERERERRWWCPGILLKFHTCRENSGQENRFSNGLLRPHIRVHITCFVCVCVCVYTHVYMYMYTTTIGGVLV